MTSVRAVLSCHGAPQAKKWDRFPLGGTMRGKTLGVVGLGDIGRETARIAKEGFGMQVWAARRRPPTSADPLLDKQFATAELCEMLAGCDYGVSLVHLCRCVCVSASCVASLCAAHCPRLPCSFMMSRCFAAVLPPPPCVCRPVTEKQRQPR